MHGYCRPCFEKLVERSLLAVDLDFLFLGLTEHTEDRIAVEYTLLNRGNEAVRLGGTAGVKTDNISIEARLSADENFDVTDVWVDRVLLPDYVLEQQQIYHGTLVAELAAVKDQLTPDLQFITLFVDAGDALQETSEANNTAAVNFVDDAYRPLGEPRFQSPSTDLPGTVRTNHNTYLDVFWTDDSLNASGIDTSTYHSKNVQITSADNKRIDIVEWQDLGNGLVRYWYVDPNDWEGSDVVNADLVITSGGDAVSDGDTLSLKTPDGTQFVFEFDSDRIAQHPNTHEISYTSGDTAELIAEAITDALTNTIAGLPVTQEDRVISLTLANHTIMESLPFLAAAPRTTSEGIQDGNYSVDLLGKRPVRDHAQLVVAPTNVSFLISSNAASVEGLEPTLGFNEYFVDPPGEIPSTWRGQRSDIRAIHLHFEEPVILDESDLELRNRGVNDAATDYRFDLTGRLRHEGGYQHYRLVFDRDEFDSGIYELIVDGAQDASGNTIDVFSFPLFHRFIGDFTSFDEKQGDGLVTIPDFTPIAHWFGFIEDDFLCDPLPCRHLAPEYVDLNHDGGISIFDFPYFRDNFGLGVNFAPIAQDDSPATANDGVNSEGQPFRWSSPLPGIGLGYLEVDAYHSPTNSNPSPHPFNPIQNKITVFWDDLIHDNDRDKETRTNHLQFVDIISGPDSGDLEYDANQFVYTPHVDFVGNDFLDYLIVDENGNESSARVTITIRPAIPVAEDDAIAQLFYEHTTGSQNLNQIDIAKEILANDFDYQDGAPSLTMEGQSGILDRNGAVHSSGEFLFDQNDQPVGRLVIHDGVIEIAPHPHQFGEFYFRYQVVDSDNHIAEARVNLTVIESAPNLDYLVVHGSTLTPVDLSNRTSRPYGHILDSPSDATGTRLSWPESQFDLLGRDYVTDQNTPLLLNVLANDTDPLGLELFISSPTVISGPALVDVTNNKLEITPTGTGEVEIQYVVTNGAGVSDETSVFITIAEDGPVARDDSAILPANLQFIDIDVVRGQTHAPCNTMLLCPGEDIHPVSAELHVVSIGDVTPPDAGAININGDGTIRFSRVQDFVGVAQFSYQVSDGSTTDSATVAVSVLNDAPFAMNDRYVVSPGVGTVLHVLANDVDEQGNEIEIVEAGRAGGPLGETDSGGFVVNNSDEIFYIPPPGYTGPDRFFYLIEDDDGNSHGSVRLDREGHSRALVEITVEMAPRLQRLEDDNFRSIRRVQRNELTDDAWEPEHGWKEDINGNGGNQ